MFIQNNPLNGRSQRMPYPINVRILQVEIRGEALKVYDLKRRLGLPGRRLRAYCNVPRPMGQA